MANANISLVTVSNTFDEWRIGTNDLVEDRNTLRNAHYVKDAGDFELANSVMRVNKPDGGTALIVTGNSGANIVVAGTVVSGNLLVSQNATVGNLTITGNQIIQGSVLNDANLFVLRANSSTDDTSTIRAKGLEQQTLNFVSFILQMYGKLQQMRRQDIQLFLLLLM